MDLSRSHNDITVRDTAVQTNWTSTRLEVGQFIVTEENLRVPEPPGTEECLPPSACRPCIPRSHRLVSMSGSLSVAIYSAPYGIFPAPAGNMVSPEDPLPWPHQEAYLLNFL